MVVLRRMLLTFAILGGLVVVAGFALAIRSQGMTPELGIDAGHLRPCPDSPNCVCSESYGGQQEQHAIAPLPLAGRQAALGWAALRQAIAQAGGTIVSDHGGYLHATFTSRLFRFVDDVEARLDEEHGVIQLRSASRVGRSDLGVNRQRIEAIRTLWSKQLKR